MKTVAAPEMRNSSDSGHGFKASMNAFRTGPPPYSLFTWKVHGT
jgi:hypothetical protein